jgi:hypothetical protein
MNKKEAKIIIDNLCKDLLICPNCLRKIPNKLHLRRHGCMWCVPIKNTPYCNGYYGKH